MLLVPPNVAGERQVPSAGVSAVRTPFCYAF